MASNVELCYLCVIHVLGGFWAISHHCIDVIDGKKVLELLNEKP